MVKQNEKLGGLSRSAAQHLGAFKADTQGKSSIFCIPVEESNDKPWPHLSYGCMF